jgi:hypothetical protein
MLEEIGPPQPHKFTDVIPRVYMLATFIKDHATDTTNLILT